MRRCTSCSAEVPEANRFCGNCGAIVYDSGEAPTVALGAMGGAHLSTPAAHISQVATAAEGRFPPGTLLAQRYRISGLLGKGGMGEVYRATDLLIGQIVALKLLPQSLADNPAMLERFRNEVRIARQVSHPNVCRVHDIGEADGQLYLTMEYADGEDLQSLLRRIGFVPVPKALEIARRLCYGLAAAHEKGVLHRDLKPGNILIDGRGHVLITDFGLAAVAGQLDPADVAHGTPAYMAPEQLTGLEVTVRSDIYALGLVLYEMLTGRRPFEAKTWYEMIALGEKGEPEALNRFVKDIDPAIERTILACLSPRPLDRPASALTVATSLPGGDPLAAALAAGETPSPDAVAAAGEVKGMRPQWALTCFAGAVIALFTMAWISGRVSLLSRVATDLPPAVLAQKAREVLGGFGYPEHPAGVAWDLEYDEEYVSGLERRQHSVALAALADSRPPAVFFWYRIGPAPLEPVGSWPVVSESDPPPLTPGMASVRLDLHGRLVSLTAVPLRTETASSVFDWGKLLTAARLDPARLVPVQPVWMPRSPYDDRAAWQESGGAADPLRVEAAAWRGMPVFFRVDRASRETLADAPRQELGVAVNVLFPMALAALLLGGVLAWRNFRAGRSDRRGARCVGMFVGVAYFLGRVGSSIHLVTGGEYKRVMEALAWAGLFGIWIAVAYLALEPLARRYWPWSLISWNRVLAGSFRDPLVGRHILVGVLSGTVFSLTFRLHGLLYGPVSIDARSAQLSYATGVRMVAGLFDAAGQGVLRACIMFLTLFLFGRLLRNQWAGVAAWSVVLGAGFALPSAHPWLTGPFFAVVVALEAWFALRVGLLALCANLSTALVLASYPLTLDVSAWFFPATGVALAATCALAAYGFIGALAGQSIWPGGRNT